MGREDSPVANDKWNGCQPHLSSAGIKTSAELSKSFERSGFEFECNKRTKQKFQLEQIPEARASVSSTPFPELKADDVDDFFMRNCTQKEDVTSFSLTAVDTELSRILDQVVNEPSLAEIINPAETSNETSGKPEQSNLQLPQQQTAQRRVPRKHRPPPGAGMVIPNYIVVDGIAITKESWAKAIMRAKTSDDTKTSQEDAKKRAKKPCNILFDGIFSDQEVQTSTKSGRKKTKKLDEQKLKAIEIAYRWIKHNRRDGVFPYNFTMDSVGAMSDSEEGVVNTHVPVDRRHDRRRLIERRSGRKRKRDGSVSLPEPLNIISLLGVSNVDVNASRPD